MGENLLEDNVCFFKDGWIFNKNLVACLRVRHHDLYVLLQVVKLIIRSRGQKSLPVGLTQRKP